MGPMYLAFEGQILLEGCAPDGDSLRFLPRDPHALRALSNAALLSRSRHGDGSVQLRLEGIDAPELHYEGAAQPRGARARDALLDWLGVDVRALTFAFDEATVLRAPRMAPLRVTALAREVDRHGRPIAYLLPGTGHTRARRCHVTEVVLRRSANAAMLAAGEAYLLAYTSLPLAHRAVLRALARGARRARHGVWADDASARGVALHGGKRALGPGGALVFPKLFRRCIDYLLRRHAERFGGSFVDWLARYGARGVPGSPERVCVPHAANIPFASLVREAHDRIVLATDLTDLIFTGA